MTRVGMVHTVPALAEHFDCAARSPGLEILHVVDPALLRACIEGQAADVVRSDLEHAVRYLLDTCRSVLVTCSSLGSLADELAQNNSWPVHRIDRPMAHQAAALAGSAGTVSVLATVDSTLTPTQQLLTGVLSSGVTLRSGLVEGAYDAAQRGDHARHDLLIRNTVDSVLETSDAVVLAQASMARAVTSLQTDKILTSPHTGLETFLKSLKSGTASS